MNLLKNALLAIVVLASVGFVDDVRAQVTPTSITTDFQVTITITESCTITATAVDFGDVIRNTADTATGTLTVRCPVGTPYAVSLNEGTYPVGGPITLTSRRMANATAYVPYGLRTSAGGPVWGNTAASDVNGTGTNLDQLLTVYADVTATATNVPRGDYTDTVTATITY